MARTERKFTGAISVRIGTRRVRLELAPAADHGGPDDMLRVRRDRVWVDSEDGERRYFDQAGLSVLVAGLFDECGVPAAEAPDIPRNSRVTVKFWDHDGYPHHEGTWTATPATRLYDGNFYVGCHLHNKGFVWIPVEDVTVHRR